MKFGFVGAGLSCAVLARSLAQAGHRAIVIDERQHVAGNCHTQRDRRTGVMVHCYGPHIFHTGDARVWNFVNTFADMVPYTNRVKAVARNRVYSLPVNLLTINQFFNRAMSPAEARSFIELIARTDIIDPQTFEEQALRFIGDELYQTFFYGYTCKQWGRSPTELPASILKRLPIRFNYDDNYFDHAYQGIPRAGYTDLVERILNHEKIEIRLNSKFETQDEIFDHVFYSGPVDRYFNNCVGRLAYRTLEFEKFYAHGDYQGASVINYCDEEVPFTRITEHKHFSPWEAASFRETVCFREFSHEADEGDIPYYPVRLVKDRGLLDGYMRLAMNISGVTFIGRLGTYRYMDMDACIGEALDNAERVGALIAEGASIPPFLQKVA